MSFPGSASRSDCVLGSVCWGMHGKNIDGYLPKGCALHTTTPHNTALRAPPIKNLLGDVQLDAFLTGF